MFNYLIDKYKNSELPKLPLKKKFSLEFIDNIILFIKSIFNNLDEVTKEFIHPPSVGDALVRPETVPSILPPLARGGGGGCSATQQSSAFPTELSSVPIDTDETERTSAFPTELSSGTIDGTTGNTLVSCEKISRKNILLIFIIIFYIAIFFYGIVK